MQLKLSNIMEQTLKVEKTEALDVCGNEKIKSASKSQEIKEDGNNLSYPTFDVDLKKIKINIFKIGKVWCFKYFFGDRETFNELLEYYDQEKYRFEFKTVGERNKILKYLERKDFEFVLIEDLSDYTVKIDRFKKYAPILKNSIDNYEKGEERIFVMKDLASVEEAIGKGAEMVV